VCRVGPRVPLLVSLILFLFLVIPTTFAAPVVNSITLNATSIYNLTTDNLTMHLNVTDPGSKPVINVTNWYKDSTSITVLNMPFENNTADVLATTKDYSGYGNTGTVSGATWLPTGGHDSFGAYEFDGINNYIGVPGTFDGSSYSAISVAGWVKMNNEPNVVPKIISKYWDGSQRGWSLQWNTPGSQFNFIVNNETSNAATAASYPMAFDTDWHFVVGTWDGSTIRIYVDGVNGTNTPLSGTSLATNSAPLYIGSDYYANNPAAFPFNGTVDGVQIYNHSLSEEQILALYNERTDLIVSHETSIGEVWKACVTPNNGEADGTEKCSNLLTIAAINPNINECVLLNSSGTYTLAENLEGADNSVTGVSGINIACMVISSDNVILDCNGYNITNNGTALAAAILINATSTNVTVRNCPSVSGYKHGIYGHQSAGSTISNNTVHGNTYNMLINESSATGSGNHLYDSGLYDMYLNAGGASETVSFTNTIIDRPAGDNTDYTDLTFSDTFSSNSYTINWSAGPGTLPPSTISFVNKYLNITTQSGTVSINSITWNWDVGELPTYNESRFELWKYTGSWSDTGAILNEAANTLTLTNMNPASDYAILQDNSGNYIEVSLDSPYNGYQSSSQSISFTCSATSGYTLQNMTLYGNWSGGWHANETAALSGNSDSHTFTKTLSEGTYIWNCRGNDSNSSFDWGDSNYTVTINLSLVSGASISGANVTEHSQSKWQNPTPAGNFTIEGGNVSNVTLETNESTQKWAGTYGNVTGTLALAESNQSLFMYTWDWNSSTGGEVCVSQNQNPAWNIWTAAIAAELDSAWGFSPTDGDSAANTFTDSSTSLSINGRSFSTTGTYTYSTGGSNIWQVGAINVTGPTAEQSFAFCVNITNSTQNYNGNPVDFQMMFPTTEGGGPGPLETYYFFVELSSS